MKMRLNFLVFLTVSAVSLLDWNRAFAAVSLSVSPNAITNDFVGKITLNVTGLTSGQQVQVKRYYDLNGNGIIDAAQDVAVESFKLADGQLPIIGGVRNRNVPGDEDGVMNGQMQVQLNYPSLSSVATGATGKFIFKVEDANGSSLATQAFTVTQKVFPQGVSGRVTTAAGGFSVSNAPVALVNVDSGGSPLLTVTDMNGNYSFYAAPGNYSVVVTGPGLVSDQFGAFITLPVNTFVTDNVSPTNGAYAISGSLLDAANGKPLGAVFVNAESTDNFFSGTLTDSNGNFSLSVTPGKWKVQLDEGAVAEKGYLTLQNKLTVTVSNTSVANVNILLPKATALIYGMVKDSSSNAVHLLSMMADDGGSLYEATGITGTGTNGNYTVGVIASNWTIGPSSDALSALGYSGSYGTNVIIADGQAIEADFILQSATAHLRGQIKDDHGNPITNMNIVVQPYPIQSDGGASIYPVTDGNGNFDVGVAGGAWNIALECVSAQSRGYVDESGYVFNVADNVDQNGLALTFPQSTAVINGKLTDAQGHPISGVSVNANQNIDSTNSYSPGCVSTDGGGNYQLKVLGGTWTVSLGQGELMAMGYNSIPSTNVTIIGGAATANFTAFLGTLSPPQFIGHSFSANGLLLSLIGTVGHTNTVQYSSNLISWLTLSNSVLANSNWIITDPALFTQPHRFYRASVSP